MSRRNKLHVLGFCQQQVLDGLDDERFILKAVQAKFAPESPDGGVTHCGVTREDIKNTAKAMIDVVAQAQFPVEKANLQLDTTEILLRADFLQALDKLPLTDPRDVRDLHGLYRKLASQGGEASMQEALDHLREGGLLDDVATLKARVLELYPAPELDDEPTAVLGEG